MLWNPDMIVIAQIKSCCGMGRKDERHNTELGKWHRAKKISGRLFPWLRLHQHINWEVLEGCYTYFLIPYIMFTKIFTAVFSYNKALCSQAKFENQRDTSREVAELRLPECSPFPSWGRLQYPGLMGHYVFSNKVCFLLFFMGQGE